MFKNVVVGVDEHRGGRDAIALAEKLAEPRGRVILAHVYSGDVHAWRGSNPAYDAAERERALEMLSKARERAGITAELRCVGATTAGRGLHVLAEVAGADLLVVGSSHRGLFGRVLLGDDTRAALNGASCAVAIAPSGYSDESGSMREIGAGYPRICSPEPRRQSTCRSRISSTRHAHESLNSKASSRTPPMGARPRSWRCTARHSIC